jgi:uncharacterized protein with von Willebrand factor type A (vWA) domain
VSVDGVGAVVRLGGALRAAGLPVGTGRLMALAEATTLLPPGELYWSGRATLVSRPEQIPVYDRVFREVFAGVDPPPNDPERPQARLVSTPADPSGDEEVQVSGRTETSVASAEEALRTKSFARCTPEELLALSRLIARIRFATPRRRSRRRRAARDGEPDLRRTLRRAMRTGGEPMVRAWRDRRPRRRPLVLVLDVSGSMASFSRPLAIFAHAAIHGRERVEVFCFGTRLTRLTHALSVRDVDEALRRAGGEAPDWDGGTRIGEALRRFLDGWGHAGLARGAVVLICSDGLDVGDPRVLARQMERLARLAHRVLWLNPLKENPDYAPLARGMRAALPHLDLLASGHDLASLEAVADALERL